MGSRLSPAGYRIRGSNLGNATLEKVPGLGAGGSRKGLRGADPFPIPPGSPEGHPSEGRLGMCEGLRMEAG